MKEILDLAVVGAGLGGLSAAYWARQIHNTSKVGVFERSETPGGRIRTQAEDGFLIEEGPLGWQNRDPLAQQLCHELDLQPTASAAHASRRLLVHRGRLQVLPAKPQALLGSPLLSWRGKWRLFRELKVAGTSPVGESVAEFGRRRFGEEVVERFLKPFVAGVYGGDAENLSVQASFPTLVAWEREHGSLLRAMRATHAGSGGKAQLLSLPFGMHSWMKELAHRLGGGLSLATAPDSIERDGDVWVLHQGNREIGRAKNLWMAVPAPVAVRLLRNLLGAAQTTDWSWPFADLSVLTLAFATEDIQDACEGYGFLVPPEEQLQLLGVQYVHSVFPHYAPQGTKLLRAMVGGTLNPRALEYGQAELQELILAELDRLLRVHRDPKRVWFTRVRQAVPQYGMDHLEKLSVFESLTRQYPGLHFLGDSFYGVGVNAVLKRAHEVAASANPIHPAVA